jgi:hypothetical protein
MGLLCASLYRFSQHFRLIWSTWFSNVIPKSFLIRISMVLSVNVSASLIAHGMNAMRGQGHQCLQYHLNFTSDAVHGAHLNFTSDAVHGAHLIFATLIRVCVKTFGSLAMGELRQVETDALSCSERVTCS